jgi:AcrR family transcriptional regulator
VVGTPNRDRRAERREATRQEILAAAWEVAEQNGIAAVTLREVAVRVGMQPPSLYSHFASKNAIYDAMFGQAWSDCLVWMRRAIEDAPGRPRLRLVHIAGAFFDFALADTGRSQLMNVRVIPGFTPSAEAYQLSEQCLAEVGAELRKLGITRQSDLDLYTALVGGLISQQQANDPDGSRWRDLLPRAMEMFADQAGLTRRPKRSGGGP